MITSLNYFVIKKNSIKLSSSTSIHETPHIGEAYMKREAQKQKYVCPFNSLNVSNHLRLITIQ